MSSEPLTEFCAASAKSLTVKLPFFIPTLNACPSIKFLGASIPAINALETS